MEGEIKLLDRYQLEAFASVVETMSFERAAERLNLTRAAVSQRVKALEDALSTALIVRSKPLAPTLAGEVLFKHVAALRLLEADTFNQIDPLGNRRITPLAVGVDVYSIDTWFSCVAQQIIKRNVIELQVVVDDADPAFSALIRGEIVGSVSIVPRPVQGCTANPIDDMIYRCVASPAFMQQHFPKGFTPHAAANAPAVIVGRRATLLEWYFEEAFGMAFGRYRKNVLPSPASQLKAITADLGYGMLPEQTALPLIESGQLVDVRRDTPFGVTLYWHQWRAAPPICEEISVEIVAFAREVLRERRACVLPAACPTEKPRPRRIDAAAPAI